MDALRVSLVSPGSWAVRLAARAAICLATGAVTDRAAAADFVRDIQPIFETKCYACHGPRQQMAGLRLDRKPLAMNGGQSGPAIRPGAAAGSLLYQRVAGLTDQVRMPMGGEPLPPAEIEGIKAWIDAGAIWPDVAVADTAQIRKHWAFVAPRRPPVPREPRGRNPIDSFVLARLKQERLDPSPEADRVTLLRRLSLDLIGLPPSIAEVDAFLKDTSPKAYDKQVERLLASPHYGERWGRTWLDAARYADSDGFEKDKQRWVWFYRDWVIQALNRDLAYDRFVIEQIAGDLLPGATQEQRVATGFLRNSMINEEGGIDPEQFRMEAMFDRMDAIGKAVLGITIQCAQCHNHKYDPLTQQDYYRLFAYLNNAHEANIAVYTDDEQARRAQVLQRRRDIEDDLKRRTPDWRERMRAWEERVQWDQPQWIVVEPEVDDISTGGQRYLPMKDGSLLAAGYAPTKHRVKLTVRTAVQNITAFRLELMNDPNLPLSGPGRSIKGTGALTEFDVEAAPAATPEKRTKIKLAHATADVRLPEAPLEATFDDLSGKQRVTGPVEFAIDGKEETAWGIDAGPVQRNLPRQAMFIPDKPISNPGGTVLCFYLNQRHGGWNSDDNQNNNLGRIRLSITSAPKSAADPVPDEVRDIIRLPRDGRPPEQENVVFSHFRTTVPEWREANERIAALWREHPEGSSQLVLEERDDPRLTNILERGDFLKPRAQVDPGVPGFLHALPVEAGRDRLTLAKWLVDRNAPTTARALVNRVWQSYFGTGIVETSEDLGTQSPAPTHPELLDWLAVEFMEKGWSQKALHRLIVTSATYQQSSRITPVLAERDPANRWLARGPRFRVDAEIVRDIALAVSGLLNPKIGGPSVFAPAPEFLFQPPASYGPKIWTEAEDADRRRRAIYTFRYRSVPYPVLQTFDAPNGDFACVRRSRSNTPLQALATLNETLFVEAARALALKTLENGGPTDPERLDYVFRRTVARRPGAPESAALIDLLNHQRNRMAQGWLSARELTGFSGSRPLTLPPGATPVELAAWTVVSRVLLNLDETITKE